MFPKTKAALLPLWAIAALQLMLASAQAQTPTAASAASPARGDRGDRGDPADPKAQVPSAAYTSPLRAYQAYAEPQIAPWRDTNDLVRQRGGWRAYAREAREPDTGQPAAPAASHPAPAAKPASGGHAGYEMK